MVTLAYTPLEEIEKVNRGAEYGEATIDYFPDPSRAASWI
jgi:hypothetical protein